MKTAVLSFILLLLIATTAYGQADTLPRFTAVSKKGKVTISWVNRYPNAQQISIQRSKDSLKNFFTIFSLPDPSLKKFSFTDEKAPNDSLYYRVFVLIGGINYFLTPSKKAFIDTSKEIPVIKNTGVKTKEEPKAKEETKEAEPKEEKPVVKKYVWVPSVYVFTADDGNVSIILPECNSKKYHIKFFEENDQPLFELHEVKESALLLDKVNFLHSGWFKFELYENGKLIEKNKFLITRDN